MVVVPAIYKGPRGECTLDDDTVLWAARMCVGEGGKKCSRGKASAMLWSLMHRWQLWDKKQRYPSYLSLMRAFSQPINPRWQAGGDLAEKWKGTVFASPARLLRRARISSLKWGEIAPHIRKAVEDFRDGLLFPPDVLTTISRARITNWASLSKTPKKYPHGVNIDGDWFFEDNGILDGIVRVEPV